MQNEIYSSFSNLENDNHIQFNYQFNLNPLTTNSAKPHDYEMGMIYYNYLFDEKKPGFS
jgi:hypothetical protein